MSNYDRLRIDKALGNFRTSDNDKNEKNKKKKKKKNVRRAWALSISNNNAVTGKNCEL